MITLLSYPRSGRNLLRHMLKCIDIEVYATHRPLIYSEWPLKPHDKLIMIVRDYRECIPRHLYPGEKVNDEMILRMFGNELSVRDSAIQYVENLVLFDVCQCSKYMIYYEDLIQNKKHAFNILCNNLFQEEWTQEGSDKFGKLNWEKESAISLKNYESTPMSGGNLDFHKHNINDVQLMGKIMKQANKYIFEKYLNRYEQR